MSDYVKDQVVIFKGYSSENDEPLLRPGERVRIYSVGTDGTYGVLPVEHNEDGYAREGDTAYNDELCTLEEYLGEVPPAGASEEQVADSEVKADVAAAKGKTTKKGAKITEVLKEVATVAEPAPAAAAPKGKKGKAAAKAAEPVQENLPAVGETEQPPELEVVHFSSVAALLGEKDALEAAKELVERNEETEFTLGGILAHIQREGIHQTLGYSGKRGFEEYIEQELGVKYRKARYLISIYECFSKLGLDEARLSAMGWSKAKELVRVVNKDNFDALADFAEAHTRNDLIEHIRSNYVSAEDGSSESATAKKTKLTFSLHNDQATTVNRSLDAAKQQAGTEDPNAALEFICAEYSLMSENQALTLEETIELVSARFGVRLVVAEGEQDDLEIHTADQGEVEEEAA